MSSYGENINHFTGFRFRIRGTGNLKINLYGFDNVKTASLVDLVLSPTPGREPFKLANFQSQRMQLEGKVTVINENFQVNKILVFVAPVFAEFPG